MGLTAVRYYYSFLNTAEKKAYDHIYDRLVKLEQHIHVPGSGSIPAVNRILMGVLRDCPEFFYVDVTRMQFTGGIAGVTIHLNFVRTEPEIRVIRQKLARIRDRFLSEIQRRQLDNPSVVRYVHDFVLKNVDYSYESLADGNVAGDVSTICGVLFRHRAVCMGISMAAKWLLDQAGIPSGVIDGRVDLNGLMSGGGMRVTESGRGDNSNNHAWNIVNVNDTWHYMDVTMDLGASQDGKTWISYDYFLRDEANMKKYASFSPASVPTSDAESYFSRHHTVFASEDTLRRYFAYCMKKNVRRIYFQLTGELEQKDAVWVQRMLRRYIFSGYAFRVNDRMHIFDFRLT